MRSETHSLRFPQKFIRSHTLLFIAKRDKLLAILGDLREVDTGF